MTARKKKPATPRNPFAGRRRSGAGAHSEKKYGKKDRRRLKQEAEENGRTTDGEKAGGDKAGGDSEK